jgi:hypothetical protein
LFGGILNRFLFNFFHFYNCCVTVFTVWMGRRARKLK